MGTAFERPQKAPLAPFLAGAKPSKQLASRVSLAFSPHLCICFNYISHTAQFLLCPISENEFLVSLATGELSVPGGELCLGVEILMCDSQMSLHL